MRERNTRFSIIDFLVVSLVIVFGVGTAWGGFAGTDVFVASVGHGTGAGGSQWRTTLWIANTGSSSANCQVQFLPRATSNPSPAGTYNLTVQPGDVASIEDGVLTLFGLEGYGALRIVSDREVVVNSRIYNQEGSSVRDTQGQFFSGIPSTFAVEPGESTDVMGVNQGWDGDFRYNFGLVETSGHDVTVEVTLLDGEGTALGASVYNLGPRGVMQVNVSDLGGAGSAPTDNGRVHVYVRPESQGRVLAFGSGIANGSQDPSTFEMTMEEAGSSGGGGDITAVSAFTASRTAVRWPRGSTARAAMEWASSGSRAQVFPPGSMAGSAV